MFNTRRLMMTAAAVSLLALSAPAAQAEDATAVTQNPSMMESFVQSLQAGMSEVQSWFTPAEDSENIGDMAAGMGDGIEIPPQLIEPAAGHDDHADHDHDMMDHAGDAATDMAEDAEAAADEAHNAMEEAVEDGKDMAEDAAEATEEAMEDAADATEEAMDDASDAVTGQSEAEDAVEDAVEDAKEMMDDKTSMAPVETPVMERIEANAMNAAPVTNEASISETAETVSETVSEAASDAVAQVPAMETPAIETPAAEAPIMEQAQDIANDAAKNALDAAQEDAAAAVDGLSQTGDAFQVEESVSAFEDPMMSPDQLNAIQSAAGDVTEPSTGTVVDGVVERTTNAVETQVEGQTTIMQDTLNIQ